MILFLQDIFRSLTRTLSEDDSDILAVLNPNVDSIDSAAPTYPPPAGENNIFFYYRFYKVERFL